MTDAQLINDLGGVAKVAELLGYDKSGGGLQRVQNWMRRGIPAAVKVQHPEIFLRGRTHAAANDVGALATPGRERPEEVRDAA